MTLLIGVLSALGIYSSLFHISPDFRYLSIAALMLSMYAMGDSLSFKSFITVDQKHSSSIFLTVSSRFIFELKYELLTGSTRPHSIDFVNKRLGGSE